MSSGPVYVPIPHGPASRMKGEPPLCPHGGTGPTCWYYCEGGQYKQKEVKEFQEKVDRVTFS